MFLRLIATFILGGVISVVVSAYAYTYITKQYLWQDFKPFYLLGNDEYRSEFCSAPNRDLAWEILLVRYNEETEKGSFDFLIDDFL